MGRCVKKEVAYTGCKGHGFRNRLRYCSLLTRKNERTSATGGHIPMADASGEARISTFRSAGAAGGERDNVVVDVSAEACLEPTGRILGCRRATRRRGWAVQLGGKGYRQRPAVPPSRIATSRGPHRSSRSTKASMARPVRRSAVHRRGRSVRIALM